MGRGGAVYDVTVETIDGRSTADRGPAAHPALTLQVGSTVRRVWLGLVPPEHPSPVVMRADAEGLHSGLLLEVDWQHAVVHEVTAEELAAEAAVVYVPFGRRVVVVELRFTPVTKPSGPPTAATP